MKHIVLGTAGHVDHGKTALIKALTGVDTDRLKEEKERGISIELGFASIVLRNQQTIGVVDVPGHEKFIKTMVSGASGIDLVMLVIAADEGVMPQTREHLQICTLLGIKKGIVALTKIDLVDRDWLDYVEEDVRVFLKGTFMQTAPIIPVSSLSGDGLQTLSDVLNRMVEEIDEESHSDIFRLCVDRVFTIKGFGTVITGTLTSGEVGVGEDVEILPRSVFAKIRGIQIHNQTASVAKAGQRTAINLQGVEKATIDRGDVVARPHTLKPSKRLDVRVTYLPGHDRKLKNRSLVHFYIGTSEVIARLILLDRDEMASGEEVNAQILLESPMVAMAGDRFVMRSYSPVTTIGGGVIVDPLPGKHKRYVEHVMREFDVLQNGTSSEKTATMIDRAGPAGIDIGQLAIRTGILQNDLKKTLDMMLAQKHAIRVDIDNHRMVSLQIYHNLQEKILAGTKQYHETFPLREGISKEELRHTMGSFISSKLFNMAVKDLEKNGRIVVDREIIRMADHRIRMKGDVENLRQKMVALYAEAGLTPPNIKDVMTQFSGERERAESVFSVLLRAETLVRINEDLYFHKDVIDSLRESYKKHLLKDGKATPASFKELTNLSRKYIIPLMEYFDMTRLTVRSGDHRILREGCGK